MLPAHRQAGAALRLDWGPTGAAVVGAGCDVAVVVDVLSFTTTLSVAADRGVAVVPLPWGADAHAVADAQGATAAVGRRAAGQVSLSPRSVREAHDLHRLVLPSPNGAAISALLGPRVPVVVGVSLRNRTAAAAWLLARRAAAPELRACASGRELIDAGWGDDVAVAAELDESVVVPILHDGAFHADRTGRDA